MLFVAWSLTLCMTFLKVIHIQIVLCIYVKVISHVRGMYQVYKHRCPRARCYIPDQSEIHSLRETYHIYIPVGSFEVWSNHDIYIYCTCMYMYLRTHTTFFHCIGSLKVVTQQLLQHLIVNKRILFVKQLIDRIASFTYGPDVTNKPSVIELNHITGHLKQSGKFIL